MSFAGPDTTTMPSDEDELDRLLSALADGMLSEADRERLETILDSSDSARQRYLEFMRMEFLIASEIGYSAAAERIDEGMAASTGDAASRLALPVPGRWFRRPFAAAAVLAIVGLAAATAVVWRPVADRPSARITSLKDAVWAGDAPPKLGGAVATGPLQLMAGTAQLTFASGAVVALHAPTAIEVLGDNRLFVRSGRVTPFVPPAAKGFTVVSPSGEVVDFGTEFSIDVTNDGKTDVFVISGEVAVAGGHGLGDKPVHLTQGFARRFTAREGDAENTLRPLIVDHFESKDGPLRRRDWQADDPSTVRDGKLWLPIDGRPHRAVPAVHTILEHDFSPIVGRRSVISFKAWLPAIGSAHHGRWVALVIDDGEGDPPRAGKPEANVAILLSPWWRVGMCVAGEAIHGIPSEVFQRLDDGLGPYQVVMAIDDSPEVHAKHGHAVVTAMVNGLEFIRDYPWSMPANPRLSLQTFVRPREGGTGFALIDDFSVSVDMGADAGLAPDDG